MLTVAVVVLTYALPALAQGPDPDGARDGAVSLGAQSPEKGRQFFYDKSLDRANGDQVDYYTFTTDGRYTLGLGVRDQTIDLDSRLEDADGNTIIQSGPPADPNKDQTIEWLKTTIDAGTYYIRVEAMEDGQTGYYLRFGLEPAPNSAPAFDSATYSFSVSEDAATAAAVGNVSATDADADRLTYTIESGNGDGKFAIDGSSGAITTAGTLDHETTPSYTLSVQADDGNGGTATATVNVTVTDLAESTTGPLAGFTLVDASDQTVLASLTDGLSVVITDPDNGSYGIRADVADGETVGSVRLALSGAKTVSRTENVAPYSLYGDGGANALSGDSLPAGSYTLTATAYAESSLAGDELGTLEVMFTVAKANSAPEFGSATYSFSIAEDAATGATVGTVAATDADDDSITYTVTAGNGDGKFAISSAGAITTAAALDYETVSSHILTVQADDGNGGTARATVNVTVTDVAESVAGPLVGFTLVDVSNQAAPAPLTDGSSVEVADPHGGSYGIRADVDTEATIGSVSLELSGAKTVSRTENVAPYSLYGDGGAGALDGGSLPAGSYTLTATAYAERNLGGDELGTLEVSFTIARANSAPEFGDVSYTFAIAEDAATGAAVGTVAATDADSDGLTYSIQSGNGDGKFAIDGNSGAVTTAGALDYETTPSYTLTVQADDGNGGTAAATVSVTVTDVAETSPGPLAGFTLVDASDQAVLASLTAGLNVEVADPDGGSYGIRADIAAGESVGSVSLELSGAKAISRTENVAPYSLYGDNDDDLNGEPLPAGSYTLTATAYAESRLGGGELGTLAVSFTISVPAPAPPSGFQHGTTSDGVPYIRFADTSDTGMTAGEMVAGSAGGDTPITVNPTTTTRYLLPQGLWSDGTTLWVSARGATMDADEKLYAYTLATGARDSGKDIQLAVPSLSGPSDTSQQRGGANGIWLTEDTVWSSSNLTPAVLAYHRKADANAVPAVSAGDRKSSADFTKATLDAEGNGTPLGLWSDGTDMYVADYRDSKIYVYGMSSKAHVKDIDTLAAAGNTKPVGVWSDGVTMWVSDHLKAKLYAYALDSGKRAPGMDVEGFASENNRPQGIWSDGAKMWVVDKYSDKVFIYDLRGDARLASLEVTDVNLDAFSPDVTDYARNVAGDVTSVTVAADAVRDGATVVITPADSDSNSSNDHQVNVVTNGETTITVTVTYGDDTEVYTLTLTQLENTTKPLSSDAKLSALSLSGFALSPRFDSDTTLYRSALTASQWTDGLTTTVEATKNDTNAELDISPDDGVDNTMGHQVKTTGGAVTVEITVTAQDGSAQTYTVRIGTITPVPEKDVPADLGSIRESLYDIWSDGETMWVLQVARDFGGKGILAFDMETGEYNRSLEYRNWADRHYLHTGLWSDGDTIWISESRNSHPKSLGDVMVEAIDAQSHGQGVYIPEESFIAPHEARELASTKPGPRDIWSDGETMWAAYTSYFGDQSACDSTAHKMAAGGLKAYDFKTKERKTSADIDIATTGKYDQSYQCPMSFAIWSDGTILWVLSSMHDAASRLEAYKLSDGSRMPSMDILVGDDGLTHPRGMWSDGRTMWVLVWEDRCFDCEETSTGIYAYALPPNAKLFSLEMSDVDFGHFIHGRPKYTATVANSVAETTVSWEQAHTGGSAAVAISAVDKDDNESTTDSDMKEGYQVDLAEGVNTITITVTAPNGTDTYAYTVTITRAPS